MNLDTPREERAKLMERSVEVKDENDLNSFYLYYSGTIESGDLLGENFVNVKFDIHHGSDWQPVAVDKRHPEETLTGCTQAGCYNTLQNQEIVWNAPFNLGFRTKNMLGWP